MRLPDYAQSVWQVGCDVGHANNYGIDDIQSNIPHPRYVIEALFGVRRLNLPRRYFGQVSLSQLHANTTANYVMIFFPLLLQYINL